MRTATLPRIQNATCVRIVPHFNCSKIPRTKVSPEDARAIQIERFRTCLSPHKWSNSNLARTFLPAAQVIIMQQQQRLTRLKEVRTTASEGSGLCALPHCHPMTVMKFYPNDQYHAKQCAGFWLDETKMDPLSLTCKPQAGQTQRNPNWGLK